MANNAEITGSGRLSGGEYNDIDISGSGHWDGPIRCLSFDVSGSCRGTGSLTVTETLDCSGSFRSDSDLDCGQIDISGSAHVDGDVTGRKSVDISGMINCGSIHGGNVSISGGLDVRGDIEADEFSLAGAGKVRGLLNAEVVDIISIGFPRLTEIGQIGGSRIAIRPGNAAGLLRKLFTGKSASAGNVVVGTIEGDDIDLTSTKADVVRGTNVTLRDGCRIRRVEYTGNLNLEGDAQAEEQVRI